MAKEGVAKEALGSSLQCWWHFASHWHVSAAAKLTGL